jgi:hypothetical protein
MVDGHANDEMIEIGDPTEEAPVPESPPRVVIEYRERGVPWMLIPPLLVLSAVGAILAYPRLAPPGLRSHATAPVSTDATRPVAVLPTSPAMAPNPDPSVVGPTDEGSDSQIPTIVPVAPLTPPVAPIEPPAAPETNPAPASFPRVDGLGFDPKALETERKADAAIEPAGQEKRSDEPGRAVERAAVPDDGDKPREVDPDLLPPDPRLARLRQQERLAEALQQAESDRASYHSELRAICRKFRDRSGDEILELNKRYDSQIEPSVKKKAAKLLGETGPFAGADRNTRIDLLRSLGFPEPAILKDLYDTYDIRRIGERDGPRSPAEAFYMSALFLLRHPPGTSNRSNPAARPAHSSNTSSPRVRAVPGPPR